MKSIWTPTPPPFVPYKKKTLLDTAKVCSFIYQIGQSSDLRKPSKSVDMQDITKPETQKKINYIKNCLLRYRKLTGMGRGIAGVQVGIPEKIVAVYDKDVAGEVIILINPTIIKVSKEQLQYPEMCMSSQPAIASVIRPAWIEFKYYDEKGNEHIWNTKDTTEKGRIYNRIFEHELDHLEGYINIDRVNAREIIYESDPDFYKTAEFKKV